MKLEAVQITAGYRGKEILHNVSLTAGSGKIITLIGPNGSGKSTLLRVMAGLLRPESGQILLDGKELSAFSQKELARKIAFLPQIRETPPGMTVEQLIRCGRFPWKSLFSPFTREDREILERTLAMTGLLPLRSRLLSELSGGERQKAWIGMVLAQDPELLILDEPTTFLDPACQKEIGELIRQFCAAGKKSVLMVLHDINLGIRLSDVIAAVKEGQIAALGAPAEIMTPERMETVFGVRPEIIICPDGKPAVIL